MVEIEGRGRVGGSSFSLGPYYAHSGWSATLGTVPIRVQGERVWHCGSTQGGDPEEGNDYGD